MGSQTQFAVVVILLLVIWYLSTFEYNTTDHLWHRLQWRAGDPVEVILFRASWCHVCKDLMELWPKLKKDLPNVTFKDVECNSDKDMCRKYGVSSFPTILIVKGGVPAPYRGSWRYEELKVAFSNL